MQRRDRFVKQEILEREVKQALLQDTLTFQRMELLRSDFNWATSPPEVSLLVVANSPLNSAQVGLIEDFVTNRTGQRFKLIFRIVPFDLVESQN